MRRGLALSSGTTEDRDVEGHVRVPLDPSRGSMSVRKTALIIAILAIVACGLGSVHAEAAPMLREQAASTTALIGRHCVTVHSNVHSRTGTICVYVARVSGKLGGEVAFTTHSGPVRRVSTQILRLSMDKVVIQTLRNASKAGAGAGTVAIPFNWWDEPKPRIVQVSAYKACMTWTDGSKACTGSSWLSTPSVRA